MEHAGKNPLHGTALHPKLPRTAGRERAARADRLANPCSPASNRARRTVGKPVARHLALEIRRRQLPFADPPRMDFPTASAALMGGPRV